ncbi:thioredoxin-like protein [Catenaria anguillulae PL171]|uniref:Thioredoxin-like protein n=1 Tax=Catenaria anguillulae PL171 TaxID=765915 RepID=A0A1Y2HM60_9FUNG|nr:thioredoxin-like protein [Catenaria anguillulae PL171]
MSSVIRKPLPAFKAPLVLPSGEIKEVTNKDTSANYTFVCPTELLAFSDSIAKFQAVGAEVVGVSCDSEYTHLSWTTTPRKQGGLGPDFKLPLLADRTRHLSTSLGCLIEEDGHPFRATYFVNPEGVVVAAHINDAPVGRSVDETLRTVQAFQFVAKHGEVCPVNFKPEDRKVGLVPDPKKAKEYFEKVNA